MKKNTLKFLLVFSFLIFSLSTAAQSTASDEDTSEITSCTDEGTNTSRGEDVDNPVNVGTVDDRSCYANYKEVTIDDTVWGVYNITRNSNHQDQVRANGTKLQPRIERSLSRSRTTGVGSFARFTGTVRILEVGDATGITNDGSYIMQAKGKHSGGGGSADPAICLYIARPVYGVDDNGKFGQVAFKLYREQINFRGGEGSSGRREVFLTEIEKNVATDIVLEVGFREDPNDPSKRIHYADATIGGETFNWNIPEPEKGNESGIRYGAYRVKGGRAQIRWANTTYQKKEVVYSPEVNTEFSRFRNVATGKFLTHNGQSAKPVLMSDSGEEDDKYWAIVPSGNFFNIDSKTFGILRAPGAGFKEGPYVVVSTGNAPPSADADKIWKVHRNENNDTYRFESNQTGRYLYAISDEKLDTRKVDETDERSVWELIPEGEVLSVSDSFSEASSIHIFPNPASGSFNIALNNIGESEVVVIDMLGKTVFKTTTNLDRLQVARDGRFNAGVYIVKVTSTEAQPRIFHQKLILD